MARNSIWKSMSLSRRAALAGAAALMLGGTPALAQSEDWSAVVAAAKKEGRVVLYSALVGNPHLKTITQNFTKKYGITVDSLEMRGSEIRERTRVEHAAGRFLADVTFTSDGQAGLIDREDKVFARHEPNLPEYKALKPTHKDDGLFAPVMNIAYGFLVNTNLVKPGEEPKSWQDLADPKWKGKILGDDPRAIGAGYMGFFVSNDKFGPGLYENIAKLGPVFTRDQKQSQRRIALGEYPLYFPVIFADYGDLKGLPVRMIVPTEGAPYVLYGNVLMKNAPNPNAARLYIDYLMSEEAQLVWARVGMGILRDNLGDKIPEEMRPFANAKLLGTTDTNRQNEMMGKAKALFP